MDIQRILDNYSQLIGIGHFHYCWYSQYVNQGKKKKTGKNNIYLMFQTCTKDRASKPDNLEMSETNSSSQSDCAEYTLSKNFIVQN